MKKGKGLCRKG